MLLVLQLFKKTYVKFLFFVVMCAVAFYGIWYGGFRFPPCEYTDEMVKTPAELSGSTIVLETNQYVGRGKKKSNCSPLLRVIKNHIINSRSINNPTVGKKYFEKQGLAVENLSKGKQFRLNKIVKTTKHGLSAIDSGGSVYYLVLTDETGYVYEIATALLGSDSTESFLSVYNDSGEKVILNFKYFDNLYPY